MSGKCSIYKQAACDTEIYISLFWSYNSTLENLKGKKKKKKENLKGISFLKTTVINQLINIALV